MEHGCSVATISGSRGVLVVGGATGDDVVEFLDWEIRKTWRTLGKLNRSVDQPLALLLNRHGPFKVVGTWGQVPYKAFLNCQKTAKM